MEFYWLLSWWRTLVWKVVIRVSMLNPCGQTSLLDWASSLKVRRARSVEFRLLGMVFLKLIRSIMCDGPDSWWFASACFFVLIGIKGCGCYSFKRSGIFNQLRGSKLRWPNSHVPFYLYFVILKFLSQVSFIIPYMPFIINLIWFVACDIYGLEISVWKKIGLLRRKFIIIFSA